MDIASDWGGNVAVGTGSATGLGHDCAEAFSRQGANVALAAPNVGDLVDAGGRLHAVGDGEIQALELDACGPDHR